jgi:hypothetical protein
MIKIGAYHLATARPGATAWVKPPGADDASEAIALTAISTPPRRCFAVDHDGARYFYRHPMGTRSKWEIRHAVHAAFEGSTPVLVTGRWPIYSITTRS